MIIISLKNHANTFLVNVKLKKSTLNQIFVSGDCQLSAKSFSSEEFDCCEGRKQFQGKITNTTNIASQFQVECEFASLPAEILSVEWWRDEIKLNTTEERMKVSVENSR